jgi:hypothetical protein
MAAMNSVETFRWQRGYSLEKVFQAVERVLR